MSGLVFQQPCIHLIQKAIISVRQGRTKFCLTLQIWSSLQLWQAHHSHNPNSQKVCYRFCLSTRPIVPTLRTCNKTQLKPQWVRIKRRRMSRQGFHQDPLRLMQMIAEIWRSLQALKQKLRQKQQYCLHQNNKNQGLSLQRQLQNFHPLPLKHPLTAQGMTVLWQSCMNHSPTQGLY